MASAVLFVATSGKTAVLAFGAVLGGLLWFFWALSTGYLLLLALGAALHPVLRGRACLHPVPGAEPIQVRDFCILIPAHNEELLLGKILDRLHTLDYPTEAYHIVVIADNCTDRTAEVARAHGAEAMERTDPGLRGKGYALEWALRRLLPAPRRFDAFLVVDADSFLSANFLWVMDAALACGHGVVQGLYEVDNVHESWRTRLMACALALVHYVKPLGRNCFGLSDGLKGNGMCFSRAVLEQIPWSGESITEDIEYTLRLVQAGIRIEFAPAAVVRAQMPTTGKQAATQRQRWEGGRYALLRRALGLLASGIRTGRAMVVDRAAELIIPPFVELFALPAVSLLGGLLWLRILPHSFVAHLWVWGWGGVLAAEMLYLAVGLRLARVPLSVASALLCAPFYISWKLALCAAMLLRRGTTGWQRTERHTIS